MAAIVAKNFCIPCTAICNSTLNNPFCLFVSTSALLNIIPISTSIKLLLSNSNSNSNYADGNQSCQAEVRYLIINTVLCICNIIAAIYLAHRVLLQQDKTLTNSNFYKKENAFHRTIHLLCYDVGIAIYIPLLIWFYMHQWRGFFSLLLNDESCQSDRVHGAFQTCLFFGWAYIIIGTLTFCCSSFCCTHFYQFQERVPNDIEQGQSYQHSTPYEGPNNHTSTMPECPSNKEKPLVSQEQEAGVARIPVAIATPITTTNEKVTVDAARVTSLPTILPCPASFLNSSENIQYPPPVTLEQMKKAPLLN